MVGHQGTRTRAGLPLRDLPLAVLAILLSVLLSPLLRSPVGVVAAPSLLPPSQVQNNPVEVLTGGNNYFLKVNVQDSRVRFRVGLANNDAGGYEPLSGMKNRYAGRGYGEWAIINGDYFGSGCPSNVNCAQGLTYIDGGRKDNWSAYGTTWPVRGNIGFDSSNSPQISIGDGQTKRHMVVAGGPWIVKDGGTPTCSATFGNGTTTFSTGEQFTGDQRSYCTSTSAITMVGYTADRRQVFMGVSSGGMTVVQLGQWLKDRGAHDVLKLDGGGSSGIYHNGSLAKGSGSRAIANSLALVVDNAPPPPPCSSPGAEQVALLVDGGFGGQCVVKGIGDYANPGAIGLPNDSASSIKVGSRVRAVLCEHDNFGGRCDGYESDQGGLAANDSASSMRVERRPDPPPPQGIWTAYYYRDDHMGSEVFNQQEPGPYLAKQWDMGSPRNDVPGDRFSAQWAGNFHFNGGDYTFRTTHDDGIRICIDGCGGSDDPIDRWNEGGYHEGTRTISGGNHHVIVQYREIEGGAHVSVWWDGPGQEKPHEAQDPNRWYAEYFPNRRLDAQPFAQVNEGGEFIEHEWQGNSPGWGLPADNFSTRFRRTVDLTCGRYRFDVGYDDGARVFVDGARRFDDWTDGARGAQFEVDLTAGRHEVMVEQYENGGWAAIRLSWQQIGDCRPPNDDVGRAAAVSALPFTATLDTTGATLASNDPSCTLPDGNAVRTGHTVWYRYAADTLGRIEVDTVGSNYDTVLGVYTGAPGSFNQVACDDDISYPSNTQSRLRFDAVVGQTYLVMVAAYDTADGGNLQLRIARPADETPPTASWVAPTDGQRITTRTLRLEADASDADGSGLERVEFSAKWHDTWHGLATVRGADSPFAYEWDLCDPTVPDGDIELGLQAYDNAGNEFVYSRQSTNIHITKRFNCAPNEPPTLVIEEPADGARVSGRAVSIRIAAADSYDPGEDLRVEYRIDDGAFVVAPFDRGTGRHVATWDTTSLIDGTHRLLARVTDSGALEGSDSVEVIVDNVRIPPAAEAGPDQTKTDGDGDGVEQITLDGSASTDADGTITSYRWSEGDQVIAREATAGIALPVGEHAVTLEVTDDDGLNDSDTVTITVAPPLRCPEAPSDRFCAEYFPNRNLSGVSRFARDEPAPIEHDWGNGGPENGLGVDSFSVRWIGRFTFADGIYTFRARTDDGMRIWVDDKSVIDEWHLQPATDHTETIRLTAGQHLVTVEYFEQEGGAIAEVDWSLDEPPRVRFIAPTEGATVSGNVPLRIEATDAEEAEGTLDVTYRVGNGVAELSASYNPATGYYEATWDARNDRNGSYRLLARATDDADQATDSAPITVTVSNPLPDTTPPSPPVLTLTESEDDQHVVDSRLYYNPGGANGGRFTVAADTADPESGIASVAFPVVFGNDGSLDTTDPYAATYSWQAGANATGAKTVTATNGANGTSAADFEVQPDTAGPSPVLTAPAAGAVIANGQVVRATAADAASGVARVEFRFCLGESCGTSAGTVIGTDTTSPYAVTWTNQPSDGPYVLFARATDHVGNATDSPAVPVRVANAPPDTTPPIDPELTLGEDEPDEHANNAASPPALYYNPAGANAGAFTVVVDTADPESGIAEVDFPPVFGADGGTDLAEPYGHTYRWTAGATATGSRSVTATNGAGLSAASSFVVRPDRARPSVILTAPADGATVANGQVVRANAADALSGVAGVEFRFCPGTTCGFDAGTRIDVDTTSPYAVPWTDQPADGTYTLVARATDNVGNATDSGRATVVVDNVPNPPNDDFDDATPVDLLPFTDTLHTAGATSASDDPNVSCPTVEAIGQTVWYRYRANVAGRVEIDTVGSDYDTVLAVYTSSRGALSENEVACHDDIDASQGNLRSQVSFDIVGGETYHVMVAAAGNDPGGSLTLRINDTTPPSASLTLTESGPYGLVALPGNTTLFYNSSGTRTGTFTVRVEANDPESGIAAVEFPDVFGDDGGTDTEAPFEHRYAWPAGATAGGRFAVTVRNGAGIAASPAPKFAVKPDLAKPAVAIASPKPTADVPVPTVREGRVIRLTASDKLDGVTLAGVAAVEFRFCLVQPGIACTWAAATQIGTDPVAPYAVTWANQPADGTYRLLARATDNVGNVGQAKIVTVRVANGARAAAEPTVRDADTTAPAVTLTAPAAGSALAGRVVLIAEATDDGTGVAQVEFQSRPAGGGEWTPLGLARTAPYERRVDVTGWAAGDHLLRAVATDRAGNLAASDPIRVTVAEAVPPTPADPPPPPDAAAAPLAVGPPPAASIPTGGAPAHLALTQPYGGIWTATTWHDGAAARRGHHSILVLPM